MIQKILSRNQFNPPPQFDFFEKPNFKPIDFLPDAPLAAGATKEKRSLLQKVAHSVKTGLVTSNTVFGIGITGSFLAWNAGNRSLSHDLGFLSAIFTPLAGVAAAVRKYRVLSKEENARVDSSQNPTPQRSALAKAAASFSRGLVIYANCFSLSVLTATASNQLFGTKLPDPLLLVAGSAVVASGIPVKIYRSVCQAVLPKSQKAIQAASTGLLTSSLTLFAGLMVAGASLGINRNHLLADKIMAAALFLSALGGAAQTVREFRALNKKQETNAKETAQGNQIEKSNKWIASLRAGLTTCGILIGTTITLDAIARDFFQTRSFHDISNGGVFLAGVAGFASMVRTFCILSRQPSDDLREPQATGCKTKMWEKVMESLKEGYICHALSCSIGAILLGGGGPNLAPTVKAAALLGALKSAHKYRSLCVAEGSPTLKEHWTNGSKWKKAGIVSASFLSLAASGVFYLGPSKAATLASELANRASASLQETWHQTLYTTEKKEFTKTKFEWLKTQTVEEEMIRLANLADASHRIYPNEVLFDCALDPNDLTQIEKAYTRLRKEAIKFHPDKHSKDKEELANKAMGVVTDAFNALKEHKNCLKPRDPLDPPLTTEEAKKCADAREKIAPPDGEEPDPASVCYNHDALFTIAKTKLSPHWFARLFGATSKCMISSDDSTSEAPITECADV